MRHRIFAPPIYSGKQAAVDLLAMFQRERLDQRKLDQLLRTLEGAADAAWTALMLLSALGEEKVNQLPLSVGDRLQVLSQKATADNKPSWVGQRSNR